MLLITENKTQCTSTQGLNVKGRLKTFVQLCNGPVVFLRKPARALNRFGNSKPGGYIEDRVIFGNAHLQMSLKNSFRAE